MTTPISRAAVLEILRTPAASDTFLDMIRRVEALEGCGVRVDESAFMDAVWGALKADANDLRKQQRILEAFRAALEPVPQPETGPGELLPCPFCGGEAVLCKPFAGRPYVACETSFCSGPKDTAEEAIAAWNRRAAREPGTEPTPGQFTTMCLAIEDVVTGRGFDVAPWQPIETAQRPEGEWVRYEDHAAALTEALATIARQEAELAAAREEVAQLRALLPERGYGEDDAMYERRLLSIRERTSRRVP